MLSSLLAAGDFVSPTIDYHALAPEIVLGIGIVLVILIDLFVDESKRWITATVSGIVLLAALLPVVTLSVTDPDVRSMFDGRYVVDNFSLVMKGLFLLAGYIVVLLSTNEIEEGGYHQGEYYVMLLSSIMGMVMMCSARDLVSVFVALEFLSIPAYMMAAWRKRDRKSNEAGVKYFLLGVFASAVMLYGMSLLYGATGSTKLIEIGEAVTGKGQLGGIEVMGIVFVIVGFAFKVSAVPFHTWAPDTYEGAPTPVTAFLSVASKAAGFVALILMVYLTFPHATDVYRPFIWVLSALTMTIGNVVALKQTNIVRLLAYSSISQGGFILMPLVVAGSTRSNEASLRAIVVYLIIYAATNLGAFAVIIAVSRKTRSGAVSSYGGLFGYAPGLTVLMTIFLASLAGIPPLGGWYAKFGVFNAVLTARSGWGYSIAVIGAVNAVIATAYYVVIMREMWMKPAPDGDIAPVRVPGSIKAALAITAVATVVFGVLPGVTSYSGITELAGAFGL
ncbi:MAG TPA: NADH-quinone oxidoreductase subunit N [Ilumatobacteraceae bacterium]|jgi:NADH-quinone oxidoreductase subunit N|nr:NADH-quinone oxidoreductase subunit N [Ilumatobacteraceae bacterium]